MGIENVSTSYVSDDSAFEDFEKFIEHSEERPQLREDGCIKVTIDPAIRSLHLDDPRIIQQFLIDCTQSMKTVKDLHINNFVEPGFWYSWSEKTTCDQKRVFLSRSKDAHRYELMTCCTKKLEVGGVEAVLEHLFEHLLQKQETNSPLVATMPSYSKQLKKEGADLLSRYQEYKKNRTFLPAAQVKQVPVTEHCPCRECVIGAPRVSDDDDDLDDWEGFDHESSDGAQEVSGDFVDEVVEETGFTADPPLYGYGETKDSRQIPITKNLCLSSLVTILSFLTVKFPGLMTSFVYFGRLHTHFPAHIEDALLWSVNYLHLGAPKLWIIIPPWATALLDYHLRTEKISLWHNACTNLLGHKCYLPSISWLKERNIPFKVAIQRPGDLIILYPNTVHFGFNLGYNVAEAVNFATKSWIPYGINALKCCCYPLKQVHLDVGALVAAFRPDILDDYLQSKLIPTPDLARSLRTLCEGVINKKPQEDQVLSLVDKKVANPRKRAAEVSCVRITCPMPHCLEEFAKGASLMKHVKNRHLPFLDSHNLIEKAEQQCELSKQRK